MIELEENLKELNDLALKVKELKDSMNLDSLINEASKLEEETLKDGFWNDQENSSKVNQSLNRINKKINAFKSLNTNLENLLEMNIIHSQRIGNHMKKIY